jgi:hypothetical protein
MEIYEVIERKIEYHMYKVKVNLFTVILICTIWYFIISLFDSFISEFLICLISIIILFTLIVYIYGMYKLSRKIDKLYRRYMYLIQERAYKDKIYN